VSELLYSRLRDALELPEPAAAWLLDVWEMIQTLDDYADHDEVSRERLDRLVWLTFVKMPGNPFFLANAATLTPALATAALKWQASDSAEREGAADARSYMWRAGYYDLVLLVHLICHGADAARLDARSILEMYGESLDDYLQEFSHA
jgi:hypothetical protein